MLSTMLKRRSLQGPAPFSFNSPARSVISNSTSTSTSTSSVSTPKLESETSSNFSVQVAVRIRPSKPGEERPPNGDPSSQPPYIAHYTSNVISLPSLNSTFQYKKLISPETNQSDVYTGLVCPLINQFKSGYNATILAYGQTSSGKTYTMGTDTIKNNESDGIIPRAIGDIFDLEDLEGKSQISISYLEIYNDDPIDLLSNNPGSRADIQVFENSKGQITWTGVTLVPVKRLEDVLRLLDQGSLHRRTGNTAMNSNSSRSHAIFTVYLKRDFVGENGMSTSIQSKFHFVDLAGSERLKRTGASGDRAKEGISINGGLLALGNVIHALGKANGRSSHIPYRDSKLTRLLQDSIGGNSHTLMIACISPAYSDLTETLTTLQYANRAQRIKSKVVKNLTQTDDVDSLKLRVKSLETELELMKKNLIAPVVTIPIATTDPHQNTYPKVIEFLLSRVDNLTQDLHNSRVQYHKMHRKYTHLIDKIKRNGPQIDTDLSMTSFNLSTLSPTGMNFNTLDIYNPLSPSNLNPPPDNHINLSESSTSTSREATPNDSRSLSPKLPMGRPRANTISVPKIPLESNNDRVVELERNQLKAENLELTRKIEQLTQKLTKLSTPSSVASPLLSSSDLTLATEADADRQSKHTAISEYLAQGFIIGTDAYNTLTVEEKLQLLEDREKKELIEI